MITFRVSMLVFVIILQNPPDNCDFLCVSYNHKIKHCLKLFIMEGFNVFITLFVKFIKVSHQKREKMRKTLYMFNISLFLIWI